MRAVALAGAALVLLVMTGGCRPGNSVPPVPTVGWNQEKYGSPPARRSLSAVAVSTDKTWVTVREKPAGEIPAAASSPPAAGVVRYRLGGMDCGDCQHLIASELGKLSGVRLARISQSPPEATVEYDPAKLNDKQIEGTVAGLGLWPQPLPSAKPSEP